MFHEIIILHKCIVCSHLVEKVCSPPTKIHVIRQLEISDVLCGRCNPRGFEHAYGTRDILLSKLPEGL